MQQDKAFSVVKGSFQNGRMPHAYLVVGAPRGNGLELSRSICSLLLCTNKASAPCGICDSCRRVASGGHPDVLIIEPEKKSRIIGIDAMKEAFLPWCNRESFAGGYKIGILLFADRLNDSSANAFLKTLEEPPERTIFLLVTDSPSALLPTVISRCQRLDLSVGNEPPPEPYRSMIGEIMAKHTNASQLRVMATSSRLQLIFKQIGESAKMDVEARYNATNDPNTAPLDEDTLAALVGAREKELRRAVYDSIEGWYRDLMLLSSIDRESPAPDLIFPEYEENLREKARHTPVRHALKYIEFSQNIRKQIENRNLKPSIVFPHWFTWMR